MINIQHLHFSFSKKEIFEDLNLQVLPGQVCGLLGKNGTGKTTLLHNLTGLLFPQEGSIDVEGYVPAMRQPDFLNRIFMIAEEFYLPQTSIKEYLRSTAVFYSRFNEEGFWRYIDDFDVPKDNALDEMSYGQKKKVLISFALACNTSVLLFDEPTNGLDILSKAQFKKVIAGLVDDERMIIISTHQVKDLENLIDRLIILDEGKINFDRKMDDIAKALTFKVSFNKAECNGALYCEEGITGSAVVTPNTENIEGKVDLELLYKPVVFNGAKVNALFN